MSMFCLLTSVFIFVTMRLMKKVVLILMTLTISCSSQSYDKTVGYVDKNKFFKTWYVIAGRLTIFEKGAHNATETYTWDELNERINIDFRMRKDGFNGEEKTIPQKGWIHNTKTNAHWKIRPNWWPLKFDYLVIGLADDYSWTAIGVPNQKWLWIMAENPQMSDEQLATILDKIKSTGYSIKDVGRVPQKW